MRAQNDGRLLQQARMDGDTRAHTPFSVQITPEKGGRRVIATAADAGDVLRGLDYVRIMEGGKLSLQGRYDDTLPERPLSGTLDIENFRMHNVPALAKLLQAMTLYGLVDAMGGPGLGFTRLEAPFRLTDDALDLASQLPYDLVLMDCQMPEMDGYTATRHIRQREEAGSRHTPIIAMTANAMREDRARCLDAGMDGFIPKPIALEELETAMECWIPDDVKPGAESTTPDASDYVFRARGQEQAQRAVERRVPEQSVPATSFAADPALVAALAAQFVPEAPDQNQAPASVDLTVLDNLAAMAEGGEEFVTRLIGTFVSDTSSRLVTLHVAVERGDMPSVERTGHALKGSSGNMGATGMAALGAALQGAGQKQDLAGAKSLIVQMEAEFARVRAILEAAFPSHAVAA